MHEAIDQCHDTRCVGKHFAPLAEGFVGGDERRARVGVAARRDLEEQVGVAIAVGQVPQLVDDEEARFRVMHQPPGQCHRAILAGKIVEHLTGGGESHGVSAEDGLVSDVLSDGRLADAVGPDEQRVDHFLAFEGLAPRPGLTARQQLDAFAEQLASQTDLPKLGFDTWSAAFQVLSATIPSRGRTVLLLDEISWMAIGTADFAGYLKSAWDNQFSRHSRLILVVCGSVSSWIDQNILNSTGFVGRCSRQFELGPLDLRSCNEFWRGKTTSVAEKIRILAVTGGVPRYLEEVDPSQSAEQNIRRLCFDPGGMLCREFDQIFHGIFNRRAVSYRDIIATLTGGTRTVSEIGKQLGRERGGSLSGALEDLTRAGFVARDISFHPRTGAVRPRAIRYRLSDNYVRFYLKYVAPHRDRIDKGLLRSTSLEGVIAWDAIMGLQVENLILSSFDVIRAQLGLDGVPILNAGPYAQSATRRSRGCQVDLMITTKHAT